MVFSAPTFGAKHSPKATWTFWVDFLRPVSLLELVGAELYLSEALDIKVDLVPRRSLRPELRNVILSQVVPV